MNRKTRSIVYLLIGASSLSASIRIVESTASRLVFRWEIESFDTAAVCDSGTSSTGLRCRGQNMVLGKEGDPALPGISLYAGIPLSGSVRVNFIPGPSEIFSLRYPLKKNIAIGGRMPPAPEEILFPDGWISSPHYTWLREMRAVRLIIRPFFYDAAAQTVRVLKSGECIVEFPAAPSLSGARPAETDYQRMLKGLLLNYDIASAWTKSRDRRPQAGALRKTADPWPFSYSQPLLTFTIGDGHAGVNGYTSAENGILKITGLQLKRLFASLLSAVDTATIPVRSVALYASYKGELPMSCPAFDSIPAGVAEVPLLRFDLDTDTRVDNDDYFLAYVSSLSDWKYDATASDYTFALDNYDDNRRYWLTIKPPGAGDGAVMGRFTPPPGEADTAGYVVNRLMFGGMNYRPVELDANRNVVSVAFVGYVWERLFPFNTLFEYQLDLPGVDTAAGGTIRFAKYQNTWASVSLFIGDSTICTECRSDESYSVADWGGRRLRFVYTDDPATKNYWQLVNLRADYRRLLSANTDSSVRMTVPSSCEEGVKSYRLSIAGNRSLYMVRVSSGDTSVSLVDSVPAGSSQFVWSDSGNRGTCFFLSNETGFIVLSDSAFSPPAPRLTTHSYVIADLRDTASSSDYLIITPPAFIAEAERLAEHKAAHGFSRPRIVSVNDIYADFAGGNFDPVAIRNFLAFAVRTWRSRDTLVYVVLMGTGHYDFKQVSTDEANFIPPIEQYGNFCTDDFYAVLTPGSFGSSGELSVAVGRLPCQTPAEAAFMVDKIISVEDAAAADWGPWRNTLLLVADDDMQHDRYDYINCPHNQCGHAVSSETLEKSLLAVRPSLDVRKAYLYDYPWSSGYEKPEAARAIVNGINSGVGYANYFGHGSDMYWADEHALSEKVVPLLYNGNRLPFVSSMSCGVSMFDEPENTSLSELLMKAQRAGALATFASTRGAMPGPNEVLAINVYDSLLTAESPTFGTAILRGKLASGGVLNGNNTMYVLLGDPSIRLTAPDRRVELTLFDRSCDTLLGKQLQALQQITIRGTIVHENGTPDPSFGSMMPAYVQLSLYNPPEITGRKDGGADTTVRWLRPGKPVFSAKLAVRNGAFEQAAVIPPNITFDNSTAKLTAYAWEGPKTALGFLDSLVFHGTCATCISGGDSTGPRITIRPVYDLASMRSSSVSFSDRIVSSLPLKCEIELFDMSGINVIDNGPDQGLTMEIPGVISRRNINYKFQFAEGDFRKGVALLSLEENDLKVGSYPLNITAQDLPGNVSRASFVLEITDRTALSLNHVFNTPNPMRMGGTTRFFFFPSTTTSQNVVPPLDYIIVIKIYSLGGKLLKVIKNANNGHPWDGRDQTGYVLPPNIYLYQVSADYPSQDEGKLIKSKIQKLVIHPPK
ncbi:MAG: hypothetical protein JW699_00180 [Chitinispirillaceae bacterium]|nr:hypothetical protein [Chitinispirillaceae bacterium]